MSTHLIFAILVRTFHFEHAKMPMYDSLNQVGQIIVDLIQKYYVTPRTLPITLPDGKRSLAFINQQGGIDFKYSSEQLEVCVSAEGFPILLDNLEIRGIDQLKAQAENFIQQLKAQQQQQMNQPNPMQEKINLEKRKLAAELQQNQLQHIHKIMELGLTKKSIDTDRMKLMADVQSPNQNSN
ncbi:hypothetical protein FQR65_LT05297 [Abscondita terminalis]|nr:hypothetical protein FQR65_LT05297 [Abscondita terminalis]